MTKSPSDLQQLDLVCKKILATAEEKMEAVRSEGEAAWKEIASEYGIDVEKVVWVADFETSEIVPTVLHLDTSRPSDGRGVQSGDDASQAA